MGDINTVRAKVQQILAENFTVQLQADGDYSIDYESARLYVNLVQNDPEQPVYVRLICPFLFSVAPTPALFEHIALNVDNWLLGHLGAWKAEDGSITLFFNHRIMGDYLDTEELTRAVIAVIATANELDDQLQAQFGGNKFRDG